MVGYDEYDGCCDISEGILSGFLGIVVICLIFFVVCIFLHVDFGQPEPTSNLINTNVTFVDISLSIFPGSNREITDMNGRSYYYIQWFQLPPKFGTTYEISYYCDKNGDRRIYTYKDITPTPVDTAKCVNINGTCV